MIKLHYLRINSKGARYGRTKTRLTFFLVGLLSPAIHASQQDELIFFDDIRYIAPALAAIFVAIIAHIIVPEWNKIREHKKVRVAYLTYISSSLNSALKDFDTEMSVSMASKLMESRPFWLDTLEEANVGVPKIFVDAYEAFNTFKNQNHNSEEKYIPLFNYEGFFTGDIDHSHPLWELPKNEAALISDYLLSQSQVSNSAKRLYSEDYKRLTLSKSPERIQQWINAANRMLNELALHYVNIKNLERYLSH
jgi:hypothetical protein